MILYRPGMTNDDALLGVIRRDPELAGLLWRTCEFSLTRSGHNGGVSLSSGEALQAIAGDFTGGTFFLCGRDRARRPVLYASSEGQAGLIGRSLADALEIMIGLPSWHDCLGYSGDGDLAAMQSAADHLGQDEQRESPEADARRARLAQALSLDLRTVPELLARLRDAVVSTTPDFVFSDGTGEYGTLFGPWWPSRNPAWARPR